MNQANKTEWLRRLDKIERLVRGSRLRRLAYAPVRYLTATLFNRLIYPWCRRGWVRKAPTFFGQSMRVVLPSGQELFLFGAKAHDSELRLARFLVHVLQPGQTMVDVGAHYGFFSMLSVALVGPSGRVLALEASPSTFLSLRYNLSRFPHARALHCAAADYDGELTFYEFLSAYSEYNSADPQQFAGTPWFGRIPVRPVQVPCRRLDHLLAEAGWRPDVVKMDVEGAEARVVAGMEGLLSAVEAPCVVLEYLHADRGNTAHREALTRLREHGYDLFLIDGEGRLVPCADPDRHLQEQNLESDNLVLRRK